jgi:sphingomyelin phosphodiesterase acid-like 3
MRRLAALLLLIATTVAAHAQAPAPQPIMLDYAPVLMLSDIHFDPFHDPAKVPVLIATPVTEWHRILSRPDSPSQPTAFADLQAACKAKGIDTPMPLLTGTLAAAHAQQPHPLFITVSGDLTVHKLDCLYRMFYPAKAKDAKDSYTVDYAAFSAKIVAFVALELRTAFPGVPVYLTLGNNDSGCKDYAEDPNSAYLRSDAQAFADGAVSPANRDALLHEFPLLGDANVLLPAPFHHTRLLLMQDIFESKKFTACNGKSAPDQGTAQIDWLRKQLTAARAHHEAVWVMAHIPPGVDAYSTFIKSARSQSTEACRYADPELFLNSELFASAIADFPDVIHLVLLGHTHMDEMRAYTGKDGTIVPGKLIPSVTPVNGNTPSFTLAVVDPTKAVLVDYTVYAQHITVGVGTQWLPEYTYSTTYHQPDFSGASVAAITKSLLADPAGKSPESQSYEGFYFVGGNSAGLNLKAAAMSAVWPVYTCSITQAKGADFTACACPATPTQ